MFYLVLHTALLVLAAFILGAIVGCLLKRFLSGGPVYGAAAATRKSAGTGTPEPASKRRRTPAGSAAAAAAATVAARAQAFEKEAENVVEEAEHTIADAAHKVEDVVETIAADGPIMVEPQVMDDKAVEETLAALPADATNEDKANAVGTRPTGLDAPRGGSKDNLQRIKGIGKVNEGKLNDLGIYHFDQIAGWSASEARWVGTFLAFMGRIEREDWIGQAGVLADGGETDFAKRVDKGEVETSSRKKK
jgi:predicted flap endonuclease-1-like 5' DNA nuclease